MSPLSFITIQPITINIKYSNALIKQLCVKWLSVISNSMALCKMPKCQNGTPAKYKANVHVLRNLTLIRRASLMIMNSRDQNCIF